MTITDLPTDSVIAFANARSNPANPHVEHPPYSRQYLSNLVANLIRISGADPAAALPSLAEPALYALAAAIATNDPSCGENLPNDFITALLAELRWRNCRAMGANPTGPVRRGRLIQLVTTCTTLHAPGPSPAQTHKLVGPCPFCSSTRFQLFLPSVRWRCFDCERQGALLEFAESLLLTALDQNQ